MANSPSVKFIADLWRSAVKRKPLKSKIVGKRLIPIVEKLLEKYSEKEIAEVIAAIPADAEIELFHLLNPKTFNEYRELYKLKKSYGEQVEAPFEDNFSSAFQKFLTRSFPSEIQSKLRRREITYLDIVLSWRLDDIVANWWRATDPVLSYAAKLKLLSKEANSQLRRAVFPLIRQRSRLSKAKLARDYVLGLEEFSWLKKVIEESLEVLKEYDEIS